MIKHCKTSLALAALLAIVGTVQAAATIEIQNRDPAGVGFNDTTIVAAVGGNTGTTLGEQRLNVYRYVADLWAASIDSNVKITVSAGWEALTCDAGSAVLGSAGAWNGWSDFPGAPKTGTWYPQALANKLSGQNLADFYGQEDDGTGYGNVDIKTQFNVNLGNANCLSGRTFYLGLDGNAGANVNFVTTLLHELGHGLGFALFTTSSASGAQFLGMPSIWEPFMVDNTSGKNWVQMSNAERAASAINTRKLAWNGTNAKAAALQVLGAGRTPSLAVGGSGAGPVAGTKTYGDAPSFGPSVSSSNVSDRIVQLVDQLTGPGIGTGLACNPLSAANAAAINGKVALVDRGSCAFTVKVKNLQNAGAKAVLIADNVVAAISGLGGADPTITIPAVRILKVDGDAIKAQLANRTRGQPVPFITAALSAPLNGLLAGADASSRPLLYTPNPREPGSSVSHWDTSASPNLLMEPFINADLTTILTVPKDLTVPLLKDLGW